MNLVLDPVCAGYVPRLEKLPRQLLPQGDSLLQIVQAALRIIILFIQLYKDWFQSCGFCLTKLASSLPYFLVKGLTFIRTNLCPLSL